MFALTLRLASESNDAPVSLLALAAHPRLAPARAAMLKEPSHPWTVPGLARLCHMSRATLARHFQERLGRSASELLADIRISLAASALKNASAPTGAVAEQVGYRSASASRLAFKQRTDMSPSKWRRAWPLRNWTRASGASEGGTLRR
ncbi:AraC family transcriptional regulator [Variovorax sp. WS11]|uniref:AraC family transcriptional regulator n=1 Tax=Variovorax sp. WS11 TaxID=1105204 RepID=UPI0021590FA8|nr:AraC family transcriptional regulator [Variovorax sp. WS11]